MSFSKNEANYIQLSANLRDMGLRDMGKKILTVHIAGTGGLADSNYPTKRAISAFENFHQKSFPIVLLHGVGSVGENYVAPAMMDTNTLAVKPKPVRRRIWDFAISNPDSFSGLSSPSALLWLVD